MRLGRFLYRNRLCYHSACAGDLFLVGLLFLSVFVGIAKVTVSPPAIVDTKEMRVKADIIFIRRSLASYKETHEGYPTGEQGLRALVARFMEEIPKDAWGTPYVYRCPGKRYTNAYDVFSARADRVADTTDDNWGGFE